MKNVLKFAEICWLHFYREALLPPHPCILRPWWIWNLFFLFTDSSSRIMTVNNTSASGPSSSSSHIRPTSSTTFITKNTPKPVQTVHISAQNPSIARPTGGKPNVIVVQKGSATGFSRGVTLSHGGKVSMMPPTPWYGVFLNSPYLNHLTTRQEIPSSLWEEIITAFTEACHWIVSWSS
jgi:hypothetical protein